MPPPGFTWVDQSRLAALACPRSSEDLQWLRRNGVDVLISLTEDPLPRHWLNDTGMLAVSIPVPDMSPPTQRQLDHVIGTISKANASRMGVAIHCAAGLGRTGTVLAAYFVSKGMSAREAMVKVRDLRPGSVETAEQELAIERFASRRTSRDRDPPSGEGTSGLEESE
jgi:atypical dual specificity phosphatase